MRLLIISMLLLAACDQQGRNLECIDGCDNVQDTENIVYVPVPVISSQNDLQSIVDDESTYRLGLGQSALNKGLSCTLYTITNAGDRIQSTSGGHSQITTSQVATFWHDGTFNQPNSNINDGMNVLPLPLRNIYKNMYFLRCQGFVVITETNYYSFELASDDASLLYVDDVKVIDNDNNHGHTTVVGQRYLRRGVHKFRVDYAQAGGGSQSLILTSGTASISNELFYY